MMSTLEFANVVGRQKMASALCLGSTAVSNAVVRGTFPPSWFDTCRGLAKEAGIDCPPELFGQRPHTSPIVDCGVRLQGQVSEKTQGGAA